MNLRSPRVLVVEDDATLRDSLEAALRHEGYDVRAESDGTEIGQAVDTFHPELAVVDVNLGDGPNGFAVARHLRVDDDVPVLFLTAADSLEDRLAGFEAGADDYVIKPFSMAELLMRVRALLRRTGKLDSGALQVADLRVDEDARTATRGETSLELTRTEFDLLVALAKNAGRVLSKTQLLTLVWGYEDYDHNLVEVHVSSLRKKLESADETRLVHTVRGVGYVLRP